MLHFLANPPRFLFFTGKGGVGKTSLACAAAVSLADNGRRVLLVSTDPASNVGQVFGCTIGNRITAIPGVPSLGALEIDPQAAAQDYRERTVAPLRVQLAPEAVRRVEEQLSGACTIEVAAFDEFTALLTDPTLDARYDHVIFDTAPTGHTIRLLQLPGAWDEFLDIRPEGASCVGPPGTLGRQHTQYGEAVRVLADGNRTRLVLVSRPQPSALAEAERTRGELAALGLMNQYLVINGYMPETEGADPLAASVRHREQSALASTDLSLAALPQDQIALKPYNIVGTDAVRRFLDDAPADITSPVRVQPATLAASDPWLDELAAPGKGLIILTGKGGVGKTTLAAAVAVELVARGHHVHLTTTDPAAHLHHALPAALPGLTVTRVDPRTETERYRAEALATRGRNLDAAGRARLEEDLRSPCSDELAVFQAFSRLIRESAQHFVVMDTAPTGHTLLLLETTEHYHDWAQRYVKTGLHVRTPMMQLRDPAQTRLLIVTLAETTPVLEAAELQADLRRAGIEPFGWLVNNSVAAAETQSVLLRKRAEQELTQIALIRTRHAQRLAVIPLQPRDPVGAERLRDLLASAARPGLPHKAEPVAVSPG